MEGLIFGILRYLLFENTRKKKLEVKSRPRSRPVLVLESGKVSTVTPLQEKLQDRAWCNDPRSHPILQFVLESAKTVFSGVVQSHWPNQESGGEEGGRGSPDALNASIMQTRDVFSNWANKCHVNKIVYCIVGWHIGIYENKVY